MMKKIEKDGMIYYVQDAYCKDLRDDTSPLQLTQVADFVVSKSSNQLLKNRVRLLDIIDNHIHFTQGNPPESFTLPKKNTDWDTVTGIVVRMVNSAIALRNNPEVKLQFTITVGKIKVLMTREYDVTYINVMAPRQSGKSTWLKELETTQNFNMPVWLVKRGENTGHFSQIFLVDEVMPVAVANKSIIIRTSTPR